MLAPPHESKLGGRGTGTEELRTGPVSGRGDWLNGQGVTSHARDWGEETTSPEWDLQGLRDPVVSTGLLTCLYPLLQGAGWAPCLIAASRAPQRKLMPPHLLLQGTSSALASSSPPRGSWSTQALWVWPSLSGSWAGASLPWAPSATRN